MKRFLPGGDPTARFELFEVSKPEEDPASESKVRQAALVDGPRAKRVRTDAEPSRGRPEGQVPVVHGGHTSRP
jgi:hypothetical protein